MADSAVILSNRRRVLTPRGAAVRQKLLELTTSLLSREGYAATTLQKLSDEAKLGRGSVLHQFPTRHDLMASVCGFIGDCLYEISERQLEILDDPWMQLEAFADNIWEAANTVPGQALAEIAFAARWDTGLSDRIQSEIERMNESHRSRLRQCGVAAGIADLDRLESRVQMLIAGAHGLVLDRYLHQRGNIVQAALQDMKGDFHHYLTKAKIERDIVPTRSRARMKAGSAVQRG